jgi:hypothetical protein
MGRQLEGGELVSMRCRLFSFVIAARGPGLPVSFDAQTGADAVLLPTAPPDNLD